MVGHSEIVGKPAAFMLMAEGATVTVCHHLMRSVAAHSRRADAVLVAVGKPRFLHADMVKPGAAVIDIGIKVKGEVGLGSAVVLRPRGAVAWRMTTGDLAGETSNAFAGGTTRFVVSGAKYDAGALAVQFGLDLTSGDRVRFGVTYEGTYGDRYEAQAIRAGGAWRF